MDLKKEEKELSNIIKDKEEWIYKGEMAIEFLKKLKCIASSEKEKQKIDYEINIILKEINKITEYEREFEELKKEEKNKKL